MRNTELLVEAFHRIVVHRIPLCDDLLLELESGVKVRVSSVLQEIEEATEIMPTTLAELLGLPGGVTYAVGCQVYRTAIAPRPHLKRQPPITRVPEPTVYSTTNGKQKQPRGRRFDDETIRKIRQQAAGGETRQQLGGRYGVDPSFIGEICRRVAYADVV